MVDETQGREIMATIDAQVHAYERNHPNRPWAGFLHGPAEVTGDDMVVAMDAVGVDGALLVSPFSMYRYDASYALDVHAAHPGRFGLIKPVDPADPGVADTIADWASINGTVAIRIMMRDGVSADATDPGLNRVLALVISSALAVWLARTPRRDWRTGLPLGLIVGGALGNLIDRLHAAQVTDFIQVYFRQWSYPVFNLADCGITVGAVLLIAFGLFAGKAAGSMR